ncbi:MAG: sulfotransferase family protein [Chloroflexota bacterium]
MESFENNADFAANAGRGFIVGAPRSGTTLLMNLVAAHPQIAPVYETGYIRHLLWFCERVSRPSSGGWRENIFAGLRRHLIDGGMEKCAKQFVNKVLSYYTATDTTTRGKTKDEFFPFGNSCIEYNYCDLVHETQRLLDAVVRGDEAKDAFLLGRRYIDRLFAIHCSRMNRPYWVSKTPSLVRRLDLLHKMYPDCAIIHIVRDGRDVALSTISVRLGPKNVRHAARRWKDMVLSSRRLEKNRRYLEIRYEELITAPEQTLDSVFTVLGFDERPSASLPGLKIYRHREKVWRTGLTMNDKITFAKEAGDLLIELGYEKDDAWVG